MAASNVAQASTAGMILTFADRHLFVVIAA